jgi:hypothetical protein
MHNGTAREIERRVETEVQPVIEHMLRYLCSRGHREHGHSSHHEAGAIRQFLVVAVNPLHLAYPYSTKAREHDGKENMKYDEQRYPQKSDHRYYNAIATTSAGDLACLSHGCIVALWMYGVTDEAIRCAFVHPMAEAIPRKASRRADCKRTMETLQ